MKNQMKNVFWGNQVSTKFYLHMTYYDMTWHDCTQYSPVERVVEQDVDVRMDESIVNLREVSLDHIHDGEDDVEAALGSRG